MSNPNFSEVEETRCVSPIEEETTEAAIARDRDPSESSPDDYEDWETEDIPSTSWEGRWQGVLVGLGVGVAATFGGMHWLSGQTSRPVAQAQVPATALESTANPSHNVAVVPVTLGSVARSIAVTGTVAAFELLPVLPQANGLQVREVSVNEGDQVTQGQVMAVLDDSVLRSQIDESVAQVEASRSAVLQREAEVSRARAAFEQSQAELAQVRAGLVEAQAGLEQSRAKVAEARANQAQAARERDRYRSLAENGAVSRQESETRATAAQTAAEAVRVAQADVSTAQAKITSAQANISGAEANISSARAELDSAQANLRSAQAEVRSSEARVEQLRKQLQQTIVRAPKAGIVAEKIARIGDVSSGSQKLFSIIRENQLELQVQVPETQLPAIRLGSAVNISSDTDKRIQVRGTVREIAPLVDPQNRQATVKIDLPSSELLRPGMVLRAEIAGSTATALKLPVKALKPQSETSALVFRLVEGNKVRAQRVEVGEMAGASEVEVKSGLNAGDLVVVGEVAGMKDGDRVKVVSENGVPAGSQL